MKILIVSQYYYPENFTISNIAEKLVSFGHDVTVLTGKPNYGYGHILEGYENVKFEEINGVKVNRVNIYPRKKGRLNIIRNYLSFWRNSKKWVRKTKEEFDVVYSMSLSPVTILSAGNLYKKKHHIPHVVHCVDLWPESVIATKAVRKNSLTYGILYLWSKNLYSKVDEILISSPSFEDYFRKVLKLNKDFKYVPQPSLIEDSDKQEQVTLNDGFNIVYCGNIGLLQQVEKIPEIVKKVNANNLYFHIIGNGPKVDELVKNISDYQVTKNVLYHGPMKSEDAAKFIKASDAVYLSLKDGEYVGKTIPNKLMIYYALGKPVIGVVGGDSRDLIKDTNGGFLSSEKTDDIVKTIKNVINTSKEELSSIGTRNKNEYINNFSLEKISKLIENELLNKVS